MNTPWFADDEEELYEMPAMPTEAKLGLLLGIGLTITLAILFRPKDSSLAAQPYPTAVKQAAELQGQTTSQRK